MTVTIETEFSETRQHEPWKNGVADELNCLLCLARTHKMHIRFQEVIISIVQRVAEFEEITVLKGEE